MIEKVKERLKTLGYEAAESDDLALSFEIELLKEKIKNFTNLNEVPEELEKQIIDAVCGKFLSVKLDSGGVDIERAVQSITEGDVTVNYGSNNDPVTRLGNFYKSFELKNDQLVKFRVLTW